MEKNKKVVGLYIRLSSGSKEQSGLAIQQKECTRVATELFGKDIDIRCYVDEGFGSKSNTERNRMLDDAKQGELDAVITFKTSRISHSISHALKVVKKIHKSNVRFFSIVEGEYIPLQLSLEFRMLEIVAQYERDDHAERIRKGIAFKKQLNKEGTKNGK